MITLLALLLFIGDPEPPVIYIIDGDSGVPAMIEFTIESDSGKAGKVIVTGGGNTITGPLVEQVGTKENYRSDYTFTILTVADYRPIANYIVEYTTLSDITLLHYRVIRPLSTRVNVVKKTSGRIAK